MTIKYSKELIDKIKTTYPLRGDLVIMAEKGDENLHRILDELANDTITSLDICQAFESTRKEDLRNLYDRARAHVDKCECHNLAMNDFYESFNPENIVDDEKR